MKKILYFFTAIVLIPAFIYMIPASRQQVNKLFSYSKCDNPINYKLGVIDSRFKLSYSEAINDTLRAADIWSKAYGKQLFVYSNKANLTVNFIYDKRQELDSQIDNLNAQLKENNQALQQKIAAYKADVASFEKRLNEFNATVDKYNQEGGAPRDIYKDLIAQQNQLNAEGDALNKRAEELNLSTGNYNSDVFVLNNNIDQFNNVLIQKPEEGTYEYNNGKETISIYFVGNRAELLHTLAHEFGHALALNHIPDQDGIMYPSTTESLEPTEKDLAELTYACREQSLFIHFAEQFDRWLVDRLHK